MIHHPRCIRLAWPGVKSCDVCEAIQAAVAEEREQCAKILDDWPSHYPTDIFIQPPSGQHGKTVDACSAAAIRAICPNIAAAIREQP